MISAGLTDPRAVLMSIRPVFAEGILSGTKTVELRRRRPTIRAGERVVIYASSPTCALVGAFVVGQIDELAPTALWEKFGAVSGLNRRDFMTYFDGSERGVAISVAETWRAPKGLQLHQLQELWPDFVAPQSYRYVSAEALHVLPSAWARVARAVGRQSGRISA